MPLYASILEIPGDPKKYILSAPNSEKQVIERDLSNLIEKKVGLSGEVIELHLTIKEMKEHSGTSLTEDAIKSFREANEEARLKSIPSAIPQALAEGKSQTTKTKKVLVLIGDPDLLPLEREKKYWNTIAADQPDINIEYQITYYVNLHLYVPIRSDRLMRLLYRS